MTEADRQSKLEPPRPARPAVLVADDEPLLQRLVQRILAGAGFPVFVAGDGDEAVRCVEQQTNGHRIEAVVIDVTMPPAGGDEALARIMKLRPDLGVVLTSGSALAPALRALLDRHEGVFLQKPFAPDALIGAVGESLRRRGKEA